MNVSRETNDLLRAYVALLLKWNPKINLIGKSTTESIWQRHIADSIQVFDLRSAGTHWADLGTGAGLPGLVVSILAKENAPDLSVTLVESDNRKAAFCRAVVRELGLNAVVFSKRIENLDPLNADIVSARALSQLNQLLEYAERHLSAGGSAIFPKGAGWQDELDEALASWRFSVEKITSSTDSSAVILKIGDIERV